MAKLTTNDLIRGLSGAIRGLVFRQMPDGSVLVSASPDFSRHKWSQAQKDHQSRFKQASEYACCAAKTQPVYAELARGTMKTAYNIALSDWFHPPVIHGVEWSDGLIRVEARDNVLVTRVQVTVLSADGQVLEKGEATRADADWWEIASPARGIAILAEAWDLPGHVAKLIA